MGSEGGLYPKSYNSVLKLIIYYLVLSPGGKIRVSRDLSKKSLGRFALKNSKLETLALTLSFYLLIVLKSSL